MKYILCLFLISLIGLISCTHTFPSDDTKTYEKNVQDWNDGGSYTTHPDSVRNATHEDSIRFGLIPADSI